MGICVFELILRIAFFTQKLILIFAYFFLKFFVSILKLKSDPEWCIGPYDIARMSEIWHRAIPNSKKITLREHPYHATYRFQTLNKIKVVLKGPIVLAQNLALGNYFIYSGPEGYLLGKFDRRNFEFNFVKNCGSKIVCLLHGDDIRSPKQMKQLEIKFGRENYSTNMDLLNTNYFELGYEIEKQEIAYVIDRYSDLTFNFSHDQAGYLQRETIPTVLMFPDEWLRPNLNKFDNLNPIKILHAPSEPIIKGTPQIRSAINRLRSEGFDFEYIELRNVPNKTLNNMLQSCHIVVNQLFSYVPGILTLEAIAAGCVVLTSGDENIETDLPKGSNIAWIRIDSSNLYEVLAKTLSCPTALRNQAEIAVKWLEDEIVISKSSDKLNNQLKKIFNS